MMKSYKKLVQPYVIWISILLVVPMLFIVLYAFTKQGNNVLTLQFSIENFTRFFQDAIFINVLFTSFKIALITTMICILLGYPAAYVISKLNVKHNQLFILVITLPMWINMLVRTYAWIGILGDQGMIHNLFAYFGIHDVQLLHTELAVILGMVYNFLPFMILQIHASLAKMDNSFLEASSDLGATPFTTFKKVILPLSLPGVISGITLVFLPAISSFFIPKLLGGGGQILIGNLIENYFITSGDWNFGSAISLIMTILIMVSMYLTRRLDREGY